VQEAALAKVMTRCATHELKVSVSLVDKQEDGRTIHNVLASEAAFVVMEGVPCKADGCGHAIWLASVTTVRNGGPPTYSANGRNGPNAAAAGLGGKRSFGC
jgi:hypothetical protein